MKYQEIVEGRYQKVAELLQVLGLDSKSISYDRISVRLKDTWVIMSLEEANNLAELIIEEKMASEGIM